MFEASERLINNSDKQLFETSYQESAPEAGYVLEFLDPLRASSEDIVNDYVIVL
jgi:hypothetical protein